MTKEERIDQIWEMEVMHPRMKEVLGSIEDCHQSYFRKGNKMNLFISGDTGLGKTTICQNYLAGFPRTFDEHGTQIPVLYTCTPSSPTPKGVTTQMLDDMECPAAHKGVLTSQKLRLKKLVRDCRIEMVLLDELQEVIDPKSEKILKNVSNLLKELIEKLKVPIVMVGLPESVAVLESNRQLYRRVSFCQELRPFNWRKTDQRKQFRSLLKTIDEKLPFEKSSKLSTVDIAKRIHYASDGVMGHFMELIRHAAQMAVAKNLECIDMPQLSEVYEKHISRLFPKKFNPFKKENFNRQLMISKRRPKTSAEKAVSNRTRPKKKKETQGTVAKAQ